MTDAEVSPVTILGAEEAWAHLEETTFGRLATVVGETVDIFPINYVVFKGALLFRTGSGTKLAAATAHSSVAFEIDDHTDTTAWSVVVKGEAQPITNFKEVYEADESGLLPWVPTIKHTFVRITPTEISGRSFRLGPDPERYL